jgi:hypothetical protein
LDGATAAPFIPAGLQGSHRLEISLG